jgi:hypothetical protein
MNPLSKHVMPIQPQSSSQAATATGVIDTLGYDYAEIVFQMSTAAATSEPTMIGLAESDIATTVFSNATAIIAATGGAATATNVAFVIPAASSVATSKYQIVWHVDLKGRRRYLDFQVVTAADATSTLAFSCAALLKKGEAAPVTAADAGLNTVTTSSALIEVGNQA